MKIVIRELRIWPFELPLTRRVVVSGHSLQQRAGLILGLIDDKGAIHYGEAAPLPGVHSENIECCRSEALVLRSRLVGRSLSLDDFSWDLNHLGLIDDLGFLSPASSFALEQALLSMAIRYGRLPQLGEKSHGVASIPVPCAGLIDVASRPSLEAVAHEYNSYLKLGARSVKFKVGHLPLISDIEGLLALRDRGGARFRLDAGRKLSAQAFRELRAGLRGLDIEFFEEPLGDFALSETEAVRDPYPLALDEWFWDRDIDHDTTASFYVLKPSRLGGISRTVRWIHRAQQKGAQIILSSCYDTGLAMMTYAYLCEYFHLGSHDMGLGTYPMLAQDVLEHRLCLAPGMNFIPVPDEDLILNKRVLGSEF